MGGRRASRIAIAVACLAAAVSVVAHPGAAGAVTGSAPGSYVALTPARVLDTRHAVGVGSSTPVAPGGTVVLTVDGHGGVPASGVGVVVLNVTATQGSSGGFVTVWADGAPRPPVSSLNFGRGETVPNLVYAPVSTNGKVDLYNGSSGSVHLIGDVSGYYRSGDATDPGTYTPVAPARILDTRHAIGRLGTTPIGAHQSLAFQVTTRGGVPASSVSAVVLNVTATQPASSGYVSVSPSGGAVFPPPYSNLNFGRGGTVPNLVVVDVPPNGIIDFYNGSSGTVHLIADVYGYFGLGTVLDDGGFVPTAQPARMLDTRHAIGVGTTTPVAAGATVSLPVSGAGAVPAGGLAAAVLNVTVTGSTASGFVTVWDHGSTRPLASNLNFGKGETVANLVVVPVGADGKVDFYNGSTGTVHLIADLFGHHLDYGTWQQHLNPVATTGGELNSASCENAPLATCVSVGIAGGLPLVVTDSAGSWSTTVLPAQSDRTYARFTGVSCRGGYCAAVGAAYNSGVVNEKPLVAILNGPSWVQAELPVPTPSQNALLTSVSCTSAFACVAVGFVYDDGYVNQKLLIETLASGVWTPTVLATPGTGTQGNLTAVSCASAGVCTAVGVYGPSSSSFPGDPVVATLSSGTWTAAAAPSTTTLHDSQLNGVSCQSATDCVAVGFDAINGLPMVDTLTGSGWTATNPPTAPGTTNDDLQSVSCTASGECTAGGYAFTPGPQGGKPVAYTLISGAWSPAVLPLDASFNSGGGVGISCADAITCMIVGDAETPSADIEPVIELRYVQLAAPGS